MIALTQVSPETSSQVAAHGFDATQNVLRVTYRNAKTYDYKGVPPDLVLQMAEAPSLGKFIHAHIRGKYPHEIVLDESDEDGPITTTAGETVNPRAPWPLAAEA